MICKSKIYFILQTMFIILLFTLPASAEAGVAKSDKPLIELNALIIGGLGIFLIGIHFAAENLQHMTGGRFEILVKRLISSKFGVVGLGGFLGFLTQSGKAAAFILADLVQVQLMTTRQAGLVVFWGNVGCSLIVFASILSIKILALITLGITALGITFHYPKKMVNVYGSIFGLAMIMYGLYLVKSGAAGMASDEWFLKYIETFHLTFILPFIAGLLFTLMIQSNLATMMIAIALASSHLLTFEETAMVMYGAQAGTGIITYIFSFHTSGRARQVVASQIAFDLIATVTFVGLFIIEVGFEVPLLLAFIESLFEELSMQAVVLAVTFQFISALLLVALRNVVFTKIEILFPPSVTESLSEPEFVHANAALSPEMGLLMIEQEQRQLLKRLPLYIDYARTNSEQLKLKSPQQYHDAFTSISEIIGNVLSEVSRHNLNQSLAETLISVTKMQEQMVSLEGYVFLISKQVNSYHDEDKARGLGRNMLESVDFLIQTAIDALESSDVMDMEMLVSMTQDRSDMMVNLRKAYFESEGEMSHEARNFVLDITMLLENVVKTLSRYGLVLKQFKESKAE